MRERELAAQLGISEAEFLAAWLGNTAIRIDPNPAQVIPLLMQVGEVMALTRNDIVVHEKIGIYERFKQRESTAMVLGPDIDMRIFPDQWAFGFAVEKTDADGATKRSLQFFDVFGTAVHKVHARPATDLMAWALMVERLRLPEGIAVPPVSKLPATMPPRGMDDLNLLRKSLVDDWASMQDTHEFQFILVGNKINRAEAAMVIGPDYSGTMPQTLPAQLIKAASTHQVPLLIFARNRGCLQVHNGPLNRIVPMGPWINVMDERFHMHLRTDCEHPVYLLRKPTRHGDVLSIEIIDPAGKDVLLITAVRTMEGGDDTAFRELLRSIIPTDLIPAWV